MILNTMELEKKYGHLPAKEYAQKVAEEYNRLYYSKIFGEMLDLYEFRVFKAKNEDGEEVLKLEDLQGANLGDIESEEFADYMQIVDRMSIYHNDYIVRDLEEYLDAIGIKYSYSTLEELLNICVENIKELEDYRFDIDCLYLITHYDILEGIKDPY